MQQLPELIQQNADVQRPDQCSASVPACAVLLAAPESREPEPCPPRGCLPLSDVHDDLPVRKARVPARHSRVRVRVPALHELPDPDPRCKHRLTITRPPLTQLNINLSLPVLSAVRSELVLARKACHFHR